MVKMDKVNARSILYADEFSNEKCMIIPVLIVSEKISLAK
jgi:hypothetical protein